MSAISNLRMALPSTCEMSCGGRNTTICSVENIGVPGVAHCFTCVRVREAMCESE